MKDSGAKKLVAYHEAGHALVGTLLPHHDPVNKLTVLPRGQAKGLTWFTPTEDQTLVSLNTFKARIAGAFGGRAAEQVIFGSEQVTSGAMGDLQQIERMARGMVTQFGMSSVGTLAIDDGGWQGPQYSEERAAAIDNAIREISEEQYVEALKIVSENRECLDAIVDELMEKETMSGNRMREIVGQFTKVPEKAMAA
jgi:cell division protease FtsH